MPVPPPEAERVDSHPYTLTCPVDSAGVVVHSSHFPVEGVVLPPHPHTDPRCQGEVRGAEVGQPALTGAYARDGRSVASLGPRTERNELDPAFSVSLDDARVVLSAYADRTSGFLVRRWPPIGPTRKGRDVMAGTWRQILIAMAALLVVAVAAPSAAAAPPKPIELTVPTANSSPTDIVAGPDGKMWFTEQMSNKIGQLVGTVRNPQFKEFPVPTANSAPNAITVGPDKNLWFTELQGKIGQITTAGVITEFSNGLPANSNPWAIAAGHDGNLWFTDRLVNKIGRITPAGVITEFAIPTANSLPLWITVGPDNAMWFTENQANKIGRITPAGVITEFAAPVNSGPYGITLGPDKAVWFTEFTDGQIARIGPAGKVTVFGKKGSLGSPLGITTGPDKGLWFTEFAGNKIGHFVPTTKTFTTFGGLTPNSKPAGIALGPKADALWFTEEGNNAIAALPR